MTHKRGTSAVQARPSQESPQAFDVAVIGAGLGGLAACIFLRKAGLRVVCIEPNPFPHAHVGESLDWSSPGLLNALGLPREQLIQEQVATYKRNIKIMTHVREPWVGYPYEWFKDRPFGFELVTLHVDRVQLDQKLFDIAQALDTIFLWDKVSAIEAEGERVMALQTAGRMQIKAKWFVDASGQARLFAKEFAIPKTDYGRPKVCLWTYFDTEPYNDGTTFSGDPTQEYLSWIWDIPITPYRTSVGFITASDNIKQQRQNDKDVKQILHGEMSKFARFAPLLAEQPDFEVFTCSYQSYVYHRASGPNWMMVGEAASLPDALTANGVTACLRHAQEASQFIRESFERGTLSRRQQYVYNTNLWRMGHSFNHAIERAAYGWTMRYGYGPYATQRAYTAFSYLTNALYTKFRPNSRLSMTLFGVMFAFWWLWMETWSLTGKLTYYARKLWHRLAHQPRTPAEVPAR